MAKLTLTDITSGYSTASKINTNNGLIEAAMENTLSRDGTSPNTMSADLDLNNNSLLNCVGLTIGTVSNYADDAAAAAGGVAVGGLYRTDSTLKIRVS